MSERERDGDCRYNINEPRTKLIPEQAINKMAKEKKLYKMNEIVRRKLMESI
jgi:hypothetical protein